MDSQTTIKGMVPAFPQSGPTSLPQDPGKGFMPFFRSKAHLQAFLKGEPKVLGTVQIMIALVNFTLGMVFILTPQDIYHYRRNFLLHTGYLFWGPIFFLISGVLSIVAENKTTNALVQTSLAMNALSSVAAVLGIIFLPFNLTYMRISYYFCPSSVVSKSCFGGIMLSVGINGILLILTILELAISLTVSSFACKATCCNASGVTIVMSSPPQASQNPEDRQDFKV
ncbi:membrane-spanning 4-domains subfamily A member 4A-like [Antechinus flavipes]|uniref:membrane-spanning 4-domains subfamily A member 4A-like n=1 Tax=Antechinus flavipes TaxID=38775 RepID=UPI002235AEE5|nr:membrane-spanning 4-domains subfamily A member 4A-like [Antechinus flavipes]